MDLTDNPDHEIWISETARNNGFSIRTFKEYGPDFYEDKKARERNKAWFNDNLPLFEQLRLYEYWEYDNKEIVEEFKDKFIHTFNKLAKINSIPIIDKM